MAEHSGRFVVRIPPDLHARARQRAQESGTSLNEYCRNAIESYSSSPVVMPQTADPGGPWVSTAREVAGDHLEGVVLFGSQARGEARDSSDVDLLVVVAGELDLCRELYRRWDRVGLDQRVNPHFVHLPDCVWAAGSIWYETALDGVILVERDRSISSFLRSVRGAMADGRLRRRSSHGHPYWVKAPEATYAE